MLRFKQIGGIVFNTFFFAVTLFVPAGTIRWPRAWIFLGVVFLGTAVTMFVLPEELLNERYKPPVQRGQPLFDQIGIFAFIGSFVGSPFHPFRRFPITPTETAGHRHLDLRPGTLRCGMDADNPRDARERLRCAGGEASGGARPARDRQRPISLRASSDVLRGYPAARRNVVMARLFCRRYRRNRTDGTDRNPGDA